MPADWDRIRREFPALENWTFLNTATFGQLARRTTEAVAKHFAHRDELACHDFLHWFDDADAIRGSIARLIHADAADIAFCTASSWALSLLLGGLPWDKGGRVVTFQNEFPNHVYYPSLLAARGVEFVETDWEGFEAALTPETRLVILSTVNYTNGFRPPIEEIAALLRRRGILLYCDATQSLGALPFDVRRIRPDVLAVHGYKWLLAPSGSAFAYFSPEMRRVLEPNIVGWRSHKDWRNVDRLHHGAPEFKESAERYEGGMLPFPLIYAMGASVEMMLEIGPAEIESRVLSLAERCRETLRALGARLISDERPHFDSGIVVATWPGRDASRLARELKERRVLVSARHGNLRVSVHFYNNEEDLDRLGTELRKLL